MKVAPFVISLALWLSGILSYRNFSEVILILTEYKNFSFQKMWTCLISEHRVSCQYSVTILQLQIVDFTFLWTIENLKTILPCLHFIGYYSGCSNDTENCPEEFFLKCSPHFLEVSWFYIVVKHNLPYKLLHVSKSHRCWKCEKYEVCFNM